MAQSADLYPLLLKPALHTKVWGGKKLATVLHKSLPTDAPYGESWELHDSAIVVNGALAGKCIAEVLEEYGTELVGEENKPAEGFPLLVKFLDASAWLSVQVHPNDTQSQELEDFPRGKTEAWIVLQAEPQSRLVIGLTAGTTPEQLATAIQENKLEDLLVYAEVEKGDVLYMAANTVHALGPGLLIYEVQQSSDLTYRLYDWGRVGLDGKPRELHIEKGVQVSNLDTLPKVTKMEADAVITNVANGDYFQTDLFNISDLLVVPTHGKFHALTCIEGMAIISTDDISVHTKMGETVLIPANCDRYIIQSEEAQLLCSYQQ